MMYVRTYFFVISKHSFMNLQNSLDNAIRTIVKEENNLLLSKIEDILSNRTGAEQYSKPLNFEETLNYLSCSKSYLYKLTSGNKIPHSKRGKKLYFEKKALDQWLLTNKVKTVSEIQEEAEAYLNSLTKTTKF